MTDMTFLRTAVLSLALAFLLSVAFWLIWDVFVLSGFLIWSIASGLAGAGIARSLKRGLPAALLLTTVIRVAIFVFLSGIWV